MGGWLVSSTRKPSVVQAIRSPPSQTSRVAGVRSRRGGAGSPRRSPDRGGRHRLRTGTLRHTPSLPAPPGRAVAVLTPGRAVAVLTGSTGGGRGTLTHDARRSGHPARLPARRREPRGYRDTGPRRAGPGRPGVLRERRERRTHPAREPRRVHPRPPAPRVLMDVSGVDTGTSVLGLPISSPIGIAPSAFHGLAHPDAERATARAAHARSSVMTLSTFSNTPSRRSARTRRAASGSSCTCCATAH